MTFQTTETSFSYVSPDGDCGEKTPCYSDIQDAVKNAEHRSVVLVEAGVYKVSYSKIEISDGKTVSIRGGLDENFQQHGGTTVLCFDHGVLIEPTVGGSDESLHISGSGEYIGIFNAPTIKAPWKPPKPTGAA